MKILLIAGHGDGDSGAIGCGFKEADLTREMVKLIKPYLSKYATVEIADTAKNWYRYICKNGKSFNFKPYDYVLEVHFNACVNDTKGNGVTTGTEIYATTSEKSVTVEQAIVNNISALGLKNRGVKRKNWGVISYIKKQGVSSALLETCFIDDADDMKIYKSKKNNIAEAIAKGIATGYKLTSKESENVNFKDVPKDHWAYEAIEYCTEKGYVYGFEDNTFRPNEPVTRAQLATILRRLEKTNK